MGRLLRLQLKFRRVARFLHSFVLAVHVDFAADLINC